jgi:hypothetical protein
MRANPDPLPRTVHVPVNLRSGLDRCLVSLSEIDMLYALVDTDSAPLSRSLRRTTICAATVPSCEEGFVGADPAA